MSKETDNQEPNLEKRAWYRGLKVLYGVGWLCVFLITGLIFLGIRPDSSVNLSKSSFYCPREQVLLSGNEYSLKDATGYYKRGDEYLNMDDHIMVMKICKIPMVKLNEEKVKAAGMTDREVSEYLERLTDQNSDTFKKVFHKLEQRKKNPEYSLNFEYNDDLRNWVMPLFWVAITFAISSFFLNLIKNIVLYIIFGKRFSYW